ncbi:hypothetical protein P3T27_002089 [Kitasatospora sp. MAA19]|uniref:hypothetical protein n=1 Tax=Kitasatospora sp. MAA19 TaxID=3035090 RepID=UPI00247587BF|nr:hypothetical protein [Kitasatospora sp. MAA19]MDH6705379.1 hypothetical protein [Kitasatospora sp. MAA19]
MSENTETDGFDELLGDIEDRFAEALRLKRAKEVLELAEVTGMIYTRAVSSGVPHDLAQAMAAGYWELEMVGETEAATEDED